MSELHSESQLFNIYQPITAATHYIRSGISPARPLWKSLGCISHTHKCSAVGYIITPRFSLFSGSDSVPLSDPWCLGQKPGMSWGLEIYTFRPNNPSSKIISSCCLWKLFPVNTALFKWGEFHSPVSYLFWTIWVLPCAFSVSQVRCMRLVLYVLCFLHPYYKFMRGWFGETLPILLYLLCFSNRYPWLAHYICNLFT